MNERFRIGSVTHNSETRYTAIYVVPLQVFRKSPQECDSIARLPNLKRS